MFNKLGSKNRRTTKSANKPSTKRATPEKTKSPLKGANRRAPKDVYVPVGTWRYQMVAIIFAVIFGGLIVRAAYLQIVDTDYLQSQGCLLYTSPSPRD